MKLGSVDVQKLIPHRAPILLVDDVEHYEPFQHIVAHKHFTSDMPVFAGHFPGHPVLPGVYTVEALAQASAVLVNLSTGHTCDDSLFLFMSIDAARFRAPVAPGSHMTLKVRQSKNRGDVYKFEGEAFVANQLVAQAAFTAKWNPKTAVAAVDNSN